MTWEVEVEMQIICVQYEAANERTRYFTEATLRYPLGRHVVRYPNCARITLRVLIEQKFFTSG